MDNPVFGRCYCGEDNPTSSASPYVTAIYDGTGQVVYLKCMHGNVIMDNRELEDSDEQVYKQVDWTADWRNNLVWDGHRWANPDRF